MKPTLILILIAHLTHYSARGQQSNNINEMLSKAETHIKSGNDSAGIILESLANWRDLKSPKEEYQYLNLYARWHQQRGHYDSALSSYLMAEEICIQHDLLIEQARLYDQIAYSYQRLRDESQVKEYALKSINFKKNNGLDSLLADSYYMLGNHYWYDSQFEKAKEYYQISLTYAQVYQPISIGKNYLVLANAHGVLGDLDSARHYYKKSTESYEGYSNSSGIMYAYLSYSRFLIKNALSAEAEVVLESATNQLGESNDDELKRTYYSTLSELHAHLKNYDKAYEAKSRQLEMVAENFKKERSAAIREIEERYKRDKKVLASQNQRNISLATGLILFIALILGSVIYSQKLKTKRLELASLEQEKKVVEAAAVVEGQEIEQKRIAKDLHDGLGVQLTGVRLRLNKFEKMARESGVEQELTDVADQIDEACHEVRKIAHNMMPGVLIKLGLKEALEDLLDQIQTAFDIEMDRHFTQTEFDLTETQEITLYRVCQELLNNSLRHSEATKIQFSMSENSEHEETILIEYKDNGKGFDNSTESNGIGTKSIRSRMAFLNASIDLKTSPGEGVYYLLKIPV